MIDKKTATILALLVLVAITGVGWFSAWSKPERVRPLPEGIENQTEYFHGYEAYLDQEILLSYVSGSSMEPTLHDNDMVLWVEVDPTDLKVDDIVMAYYKLPWRPEPENIVHRVIDIDVRADGHYFLTKGDSNSRNDGWVPQDNIHGLVIGVVYCTASG